MVLAPGTAVALLAIKVPSATTVEASVAKIANVRPDILRFRDFVLTFLSGTNLPALLRARAISTNCHSRITADDILTHNSYGVVCFTRKNTDRGKLPIAHFTIM